MAAVHNILPKIGNNTANMDEQSDSSLATSPFDDSDGDPNYSESEIESEEAINLEEEKNGRKRLRKESRQQKNKQLKDSGQKYIAYRGKGHGVGNKVPDEACNCKLRCLEKIPQNVTTDIFTQFWKYGNYNLQNTYLQGCIRKKNVKRKTLRHDTRRTCTMECCIQSDLTSYIVCKQAFIGIHGIGRGRLENIVSKMRGGNIIGTVDGRGRHSHHKKKYTEEDLESVRQFIEMLPKYESHYTRHKSSNKEYMNLEYSIQSLYEEYKKQTTEENKTPVLQDKFRRIFTEEFNILFKSPKCDTCAKCVAYNVAISRAKQDRNEDELKNLNAQKELHLRKAVAARKVMNEAIEASKHDDQIHVTTFDLQQALPTPKLTTGPCFYKKKLWCYNLSIHRCSPPEKGFFYLWNESTAKRGADKIASCLKKYFEENDIKGDTLYAVSDNCYDQNKNWTIVGFWLYLLVTKRFKKIVHVFPQVGHTMLPSDRDFGLVEKCAKRRAAIYSPTEWEDVLRNSQKKNLFNVNKMTQENFFNFTDLRENFKQSNKTVNNENFTMSSCVKFGFDANNHLMLLAYNTYSGPPVEVSLKKRGRPSSADEFNIHLNKKYEQDLPIDESKLNHVMSCLQWIPPVHHAFYYGLKSQ